MVLLLTAVALAHPGVFMELPLEEAQVRAAAQQRYLLVDATATWCAPCKEMDATTWVDPTVVAWVNHNAVAIQVDVSRPGPVSERLSIKSMPTVILFRDGKELDRLEGYQEPAALLDWLQLVVSGGRYRERLREKALQGDLQARLELTDDLVREGRNAEASEHFLWLWDHMLEKDPGLFEVRPLFFRQQLGSLLTSTPSVRAPLEERFRGLHKRVEAGETDPVVLSDWLTLSQVLEGGQRALAYARQTSERARLRPLERRFFDQLSEAGEWKEAGFILTDPVAEARAELAAEQRRTLPGKTREALRKQTVAILRNLYRACVAASRQREAEALQELIEGREGPRDGR